MIKESSYPVLGKDDVYPVATSDGSYTLFSHSFGTTYHSIYGAVSESRHTYIQHCLRTQLHRKEICILEFGFGTGLNAFLAFLLGQKFNKNIFYSGFESHPIAWNVVKQLEYPGYLACPEQESVLMKMHQTAQFSIPGFEFELLGPWKGSCPSGPFDCIFFDAFAPDVQPELWNDIMFDSLFKSTSQGGCLVTYCAKGDVRRNLIAAGYEVERIPGAPGKRQMLRGFKR